MIEVAVLAACLSGWFTILCLSLYAHRAMAHRAVTLHPAVANSMRFWLWFTTGISTREWVAVHRKHHAYVDTKDDPHSPVVHGILRIFFFGYWYYTKEARNGDTIAKFGKNCPNDWIERHVYTRYRWVCLVALAALDVLVFGAVPGLVAFAIQFLWVVIWAAGVINGLGHFVGYRDFPTDDFSRNIVPVGILVSGEELHNNHHRWPRSAKFSARWWEFDAGWIVIRALAALRLASNIYVYDRRLSDHRFETAHSRLRDLVARWRTEVLALKENCRASQVEKRLELERLWKQFTRRMERMVKRADRHARERIVALRVDFENTMRSAVPELLGPAFEVPA